MSRFHQELDKLGLPVIWDIDSEMFYHEILESAYAVNYGLVSNVDLNRVVQAAASSTCEQLVGVLIDQQLDFGVTINHIETILHDPNTLVQFTPMLTVRFQLEDIRDTIQRQHAMRIKAPIHIKTDALLHYAVFVSYPLIAIYDPTYKKEKGWVFDYDQLLCMLDTISSRITCKLYAYLSSSLIPGMNLSVAMLDNIMAWGDDLLKRLGNKAYRLIKFYESMTLALHLRENEPLDMSKRFWASLVMDFIDKADELQVDGLQMIDKFTTLFEPISRNPHLMSEAFGLFRFWGHPTVNEVNGCLAVQKHAKTEKELDPFIIRQHYASLTRELTRNYIKKHGHWPEVTMDPQIIGTPLFKAWNSHNLEINDYAPGHDFIHWSYCTYQKNKEYDYSIDVTQLITDKAISLPKTHWDNVYDAFLLGYKPPVPKNSRRVMIEYLKTEELDIPAIIEMFRTDNIPDAFRLLGLHSKEREMKEDPRLFGMMVLDGRLYFASTETNIADGVFPYFPQQTMTLSESELTTRLLNITLPKPDSQFVEVIINLDFFKWNLMWRNESTAPTFNLLDGFFGLPGLYTETHKFFESCMMYLVSHEFPPSSLNNSTRQNPPPCETLWYDHKGGIEGLRQKGWTLATIGILLCTELRTGVSGTITGQGDNQVIVAKFTIPYQNCSRDEYVLNHRLELEQRIKDYLAELEIVSTGMGMPIKMEETWVALNTFAYGKDIIYKGAMMPMSMKRVSRIMTDINDQLPTLANKLSTLHAAGQSVAHKGLDAVLAYYVAQIESAFCVEKELGNSVLCGSAIRDRLRTSKLTLTSQMMDLMISVPRILGGYPVLNLLDYLYRGHPDPCTSALYMVKSRGRINSLYSKLLNLWITRPPLRTTIDAKMILQDPVSLNVDVPVMLSNIMVNKLEDTVRSVAKNRDVVQLFHSLSKVEDDQLIDFLYTVRPFTPRVLSEVLMRSPTGARKGFLSTFTHMRTIRALVKWSEEEDLEYRIRESEVKWFMHTVSSESRIQQIPICPFDPMTVCATTLSQRLRDQSWLVDNTAVMGVTVPHPVEQFKLNHCKHGLCDIDRLHPEHILFLLDPMSALMEQIDDILVLTRGTQKPFLGAKTQEKTTSKLITLDRHDPAIRDAMRLMIIKQWTSVPGSNFDLLLDKLVLSRTNIPQVLLDNMAGKVLGGSVTHRFSDPMTKHASASSSRPTTHTHIYISSDHMGKYSRGMENYAMHFQGVFLFYQALINEYCVFKSLTGRASKRIYHAHLNCDLCTTLVQDDRLTSYSVVPTITINTESRILYAPAHVLTDENPITNVLRMRTIAPKDEDDQHLAKYYPQILTNHQYKMASTNMSPMQLPLNTRKESQVQLTQHDMSIVPLNAFIKGYSMAIMYDIAGAVLRSWNKGELPMNLLCKSYSMMIDDSRLAPLSGFLGLSFVKSQIFSSNSKFVLSSETFKTSLRSLQTIQHLVSKQISKKSVNLRSWCYNFVLDCSNMDTVKVGLSKWIYIVALVFCQETNFRHKSLYGVVEKFRQTIVSCEDNEVWNIVRISIDYLVRLFVANTNTYCAVLYPILNFNDIADWKLQAYERLQSLPSLPAYVKPMVYRVFSKNLSRYIMSIDITTPFVSPGVMIKIPTDSSYESNPGIRLDHYYRLFGLYSSAHYKILEIIIRERLEPNCVMCLAEGSGSIAKCFLDIFPQCRLYYNSLHKTAEFTPHRMESYVPICLEQVDKERLINIVASITSNNDLTLQDTYDDILAQTNDFTFDVITCDAEFNKTWGTMLSLSILKTVETICMSKLSNNGVLIYKCFSRDIKLMDYTTRSLRSYFSSVKVVYTLFNSPLSGECYIICRHKLLTAIAVHMEVYANKKAIMVATVDSPNIELLTQFYQYSNQSPYYQKFNFRDSLLLHQIISSCNEPIIRKSLQSYLNYSLPDDVPTKDDLLVLLVQLRKLTIINIQQKLIAYKNLITVSVISSNSKVTREWPSITRSVNTYCELLSKIAVLETLLKLPSPRLEMITPVIQTVTARPIVVTIYKNFVYHHRIEYKEFGKYFSRQLCHVIGHYDQWWV